MPCALPVPQADVRGSLQIRIQRSPMQTQGALAAHSCELLTSEVLSQETESVDTWSTVS